MSLSLVQKGQIMFELTILAIPFSMGELVSYCDNVLFKAAILLQTFQHSNACHIMTTFFRQKNNDRTAMTIMRAFRFCHILHS